MIQQYGSDKGCLKNSRVQLTGLDKGSIKILELCTWGSRKA